MCGRGGGVFENITTIIQSPGCSVVFRGAAGFKRLREIELQIQ